MSDVFGNTDKLIERYESVKQGIADAVRKAGRRDGDVTLLAVSKFHSCSAIEAIVNNGHLCFAESYVQEALAKQDELVGRPIQWHFVGHIQSKKAKDVVNRFTLIHTVDRLKLAQNMQKRMEMLPAASVDAPPVVQDILLQVNISEEEQKSGVAPEAVKALAEQVLGLPQLRIRGLMGMPPFSASGEAARPYFIRLRMLKEELEATFNLTLPHLSMGMSQDYAQAIEEGATYVRIGTNIFGQRPAVRPS